MLIVYFLDFIIAVSYAKVTNIVGSQITTHCEIYSTKPCTNTSECPKDGKCNEGDGKWGCFALWNVETNGSVNLTMKGCFLYNEDCYSQKCVARVANNTGMMFCCCEGNYCNKEFSLEVTPTTAKPLQGKRYLKFF